MRPASRGRGGKVGRAGSSNTMRPQSARRVQNLAAKKLIQLTIQPKNYINRDRFTIRIEPNATTLHLKWKIERDKGVPTDW